MLMVGLVIVGGPKILCNALGIVSFTVFLSLMSFSSHFLLNPPAKNIMFMYDLKMSSRQEKRIELGRKKLLAPRDSKMIII